MRKDLEENLFEKVYSKHVASRGKSSHGFQY